jgi:hypothetical protein
VSPLGRGAAPYWQHTRQVRNKTVTRGSPRPGNLAPPKLTPVASARPVPLIVTTVPPLALPGSGVNASDRRGRGRGQGRR